MTYVLVKRYNPAYDYFVFRYLKENGIDVNENSTSKVVERIALSFQNKVEITEGKKPSRDLSLEFIRKLGPVESLLWDYAWSWKMEPECRPSTDYKLEGIFEGKFPDVKTLRELESQLPSERGKLLFSKNEAAIDIVNFYKRYMRDPLKKILDTGGFGRPITNYFSQEDLRRLPNIGVVGEERFLEGTRKIGKEVLEWINSITPGKIMNDIERTLNKHWKDTEHLQLGVSLSDSKRKLRSCQHLSEFVQLNYYQYVDDDIKSLFLKPSRGFRVWVKHNWEADYADVIFPQYRVMKLES
jgi:hypothetical protein